MAYHQAGHTTKKIFKVIFRWKYHNHFHNRRPYAGASTLERGKSWFFFSKKIFFIKFWSLRWAFSESTVSCILFMTGINNSFAFRINSGQFHNRAFFFSPYIILLIYILFKSKHLNLFPKSQDQKMKKKQPKNKAKTHTNIFYNKKKRKDIFFKKKIF